MRKIRPHEGEGRARSPWPEWMEGSRGSGECLVSRWPCRFYSCWTVCQRAPSSTDRDAVLSPEDRTQGSCGAGCRSVGPLPPASSRDPTRLGLPVPCARATVDSSSCRADRRLCGFSLAPWEVRRERSNRVLSRVAEDFRRIASSSERYPADWTCQRWSSRDPDGTGTFPGCGGRYAPETAYRRETGTCDVQQEKASDVPASATSAQSGDVRVRGRPASHRYRHGQDHPTPRLHLQLDEPRWRTIDCSAGSAQHGWDGGARRGPVEGELEAESC